MAMKRMKYLGKNLPKKTKNLYIENYKTLLRDIKDDTDRWRNMPCSQIRRINIVKISIPSKAIYRFTEIPIKLPTVFFTDLEKKFTICIEIKKNKIKGWVAKAILRKKNGTGGFNLPDFRLYYKAKVIKTVWYWHTDRNIGKCKKNRKVRERSETNPCTYGHFTFDKGGKNIQWRKHNLFNKWFWENWQTNCKVMKPEYFPAP